MIGPDALPVRVQRSHAELTPDALAVLFGAGYVLRGTERVEVVGPRGTVPVDARPGGTLAVHADALDREALAGEATTLRGPRGRLDAPPLTPVEPLLTLTEGLRAAWGLTDQTTTAVALGALVWTNARILTRTPVGVWLERAALLAAGGREGDPARWLGTAPTLPASLTSPPAPSPADPKGLVLARRVITENDVRKARMQRKTIRVQPGQIVTPAARSLGREWGVLDEPARP